MTTRVARSLFSAAFDALCRLQHRMAGQAKRETVVDLAKFIDKGVHVKLSGGREGAARRAGCPAEH